MAEIASGPKPTVNATATDDRASELARMQLEMLTDTLGSARVSETYLSADLHADLLERLPEEFPEPMEPAADEPDDEPNEPAEQGEAPETAVVAATHRNPLMTIGYDTMANINLIKDVELISERTRLPQSFAWRTSEGTTNALITHKGMFEGVLVYFSERADDNILSASVLRTHGCQFECTKDLSEITITFPTGRVMSFKPRNGLYQCHIYPVANVTTIDNNLRRAGLTQREIDNLEHVRLFKARMGNIPTTTLLNMMYADRFPRTQASPPATCRTSRPSTAKCSYTRPKGDNDTRTSP